MIIVDTIKLRCLGAAVRVKVRAMLLPSALVLA